MRGSPGAGASGVVLAVALAAGACSVLPGGGGPGTPDADCTVRIENQADWGLRITLSAPDARAPVPFRREIRYLEREDARHLQVPCRYGSALVAGEVRRVSGLSGMQRTRFRTGICLTPGDTAVALLDEYGEWSERWWESCPLPTEDRFEEKTDSAEGAVPDTVGPR